MPALLRSDPGGPGAFAGAVILAVQDSRTLLHRAWGYAERFDRHPRPLPNFRPMTPDTLFDLASVTKVAATTLALAALLDEGELRFEDPVGRFVPETAGTWLAGVALRDLLTHRSGLPDWLPFYLLLDLASPPEARRREAVGAIARLAAAAPPGPVEVYSDLNFILLGDIVQRASGMALDRFVRARIYDPLGLPPTTGFAPPGGLPEELLARVAATSIGNPFELEMCRSRRFPLPLRRSPEELPELVEPRVLVGRPNDANCRIAFGGLSGHAGLFADARSLAAIGQLMLDEGASGGRPVLSPATARALARDLLGWRRLTWSPAAGAYGHTGFTGTLLHIDPARCIVTVVLTNRVHGTLPYTPYQPFLQQMLEALYREI